VFKEGVVETNATNWGKEILESKELVLVEFWHPQCPYCRVLDPIYSDLAREYTGKLRFARFNVMESPENQELAVKYGIMGTPTLKFFCQGRPVQDIVGVLEKKYLRQGIEFAVKKHHECAENSTPLKLPYIS
jgi:thioredoxin 1